MKKKKIIIAFVGGIVAFFSLSFLLLYAFFPIRYTATISDCAKRYSLSPTLLRAVIYTESGYDKNAVSHKGARGLMQLMPATAGWCAKQLGVTYDDEMLFEPHYNIELGAFYLSHLIKKYGEEGGLACYNAGEGNYISWNGQIKFVETQKYIKKVKFCKKAYTLITFD